MNSPRQKAKHYTLTILIYLLVCAALPSLAESDKKTDSPMPTIAATPADPVTPEAKARPFPFQSKVISVDKTAHTFRIGKKTIHQVHVLPETKLLKSDGTAAKFEEIVVGVDVRGSVRKRSDGDYDAVSVKIGPKAQATPAASPSATPKK